MSTPPFSWLSDDFVIVNGENSIMSILEIIFRLRPQYIVVTRSEENKRYEYVILSFVFFKAIEKILPNPSLTLQTFLKLNDRNYDSSLDIPGDPSSDIESRELIHQKFDNQGFLVLTRDKRIIGIIDPERRNVRGHYSLKGLELEGDFFIQMHKYEPAYQFVLLGNKYVEKGELDSAEKYFLMLLDIYRRELPEKHPDIAEIHTQLGNIHLSRNRYTDALSHVTYALDMFEETVGKVSYGSAEALRLLVSIYLKQSLSLEAENVQKKLARTEFELGIGVNNLMETDAQIESANRYAEYYHIQTAALDDKLPSVEGGPEPEPGQISSSAPMMEIIERYPHAMFPSEIWVGESAELTIIIRVKPIDPAASGIKLKSEYSESSEKTIPIQAVICPGTFEVKEKKPSVTINVPKDNIDSEPIKFNLLAREEGWQSIVIRFYDRHGSECLGEINLKRKVLHKGTKKLDMPLVPTFTKLVSNLKSSDAADNLILEITENSRWLTFHLLSPRDDLVANSQEEYFYSLQLKADPEKEIRAIINSIKQTIANPSQVDSSLRNKGFILYKNLFPDELKHKFWQLRDKIKRIHIFSEEPWIPWEILRPWKGEESDDHFLCEKYAFTRWRPRGYNTKESVIHVKKMEFIIPFQTFKEEDPLKEYKAMKEFSTDASFDINVDYTPTTATMSLMKGGFDLIHISAHGKFVSEPVTSSYILLDNELNSNKRIKEESKFELDTIAGPYITRGFRTTNPVVFFNSCESGTQAYSLNGIGSWADSFIEVGASAFLGTLWSVTDEAAFSFSKELYKILRFSKGIDLSQAVQQARNNLASAPNPDPSRFAYTLYAPPNLSIIFKN